MSARIKKWDVVLLSYPFTDAAASKVRPAVVISPDAENESTQDAMFILITSNTNRQSKYDFIIEDSHSEFKTTGLIRSSAVRINKIWTLRINLVKRVMGRIGPKLQGDIQDLMRDYFGLPAIVKTS